MNFTITSQPKDQYLFIECKGVIQSHEDLVAQADLVQREILKYHFKKIIVYEPETKLPVDLIPYFNLVEDYKSRNTKNLLSLKIAVVVAEEYNAAVSSWEAICQSKGLQFFVFTSLTEATDFLLNDDEAWEND